MIQEFEDGETIDGRVIYYRIARRDDRASRRYASQAGAGVADRALELLLALLHFLGAPLFERVG